jgi:hypothetical protein
MGGFALHVKALEHESLKKCDGLGRSRNLRRQTATVKQIYGGEHWRTHVQKCCCVLQSVLVRFEAYLRVVPPRELCSNELCFNIAPVLISAVPIFRIFGYLHNEHAVLSPSGVQSIKLQISVGFLRPTTLSKH